MYYDSLIKIPENTGRITVNRRGDTTYIEYTYDRKYVPEKKYNVPKRTTIGKLSKTDPTMMQPNQNFVKFFPDIALQEEQNHSNRSSCLRIGGFLIIRKIMEEYKLPEILSNYWDDRGVGLFLDLAAYSIICENNAGQYYPEYAYNHPLLTEGMKIYSDSTVSRLLASITEDDKVGFLNNWNASRNHREQIYISYDSTNKNCQAGDIEMVEYGHPKDDKGLPIFNYSVAYDINNKEPLFYESYPGSIVDVSQLQYMLEKATGYGYKKIGFILDRGYFSKKNIQYMDSCNYDFVIMVKGMASFVENLILENKGSFEKKRSYVISEYEAYGKTVQGKLYADDEKDRYFHIYHKISKESAESGCLESKIKKMTEFLKRQEGKVATFSDVYHHYFDLFMNKKEDGTTKFLYAKEKSDVIERELSLCGYFVIVTSKKMTACEALSLYKSRDVSEKLFRGDKSYLGNRSLRVHTNESADAKIFIEFVAMIVRCKIYTRLKSFMAEMAKKPNYMTVPAALKELEKIEMVRRLDHVYRLDHAVTATQKTILKAFGVDENYINEKALRLSEQLKSAAPAEKEEYDDTNKEDDID
ncbi:MAG TPA: transposase [Lachnospiraceae bacterium]|nr:transposase [Lachnospiraceae bacterium]